MILAINIGRLTPICRDNPIAPYRSVYIRIIIVQI